MEKSASVTQTINLIIIITFVIYAHFLLSAFFHPHPASTGTPAVRVLQTPCLEPVKHASCIGFCTLCFCFPTKMLHLNAPFFPLKCSVSPKKSLKCSDNALYTKGFFKINFKVYTYKNVQVLQVTTTTCTSS